MTALEIRPEELLPVPVAMLLERSRAARSRVRFECVRKPLVVYVARETSEQPDARNHVDRFDFHRKAAARANKLMSRSTNRVDFICLSTAKAFGIEPRSLFERCRRHALARQVAMFLLRRVTTLTLPQIGAYFAGRDHTTVLHACRVVELRKAEPGIAEKIAAVMAELEARA